MINLYKYIESQYLSYQAGTCYMKSHVARTSKSLENPELYEQSGYCSNFSEEL
jgi:hypothetical protein